MTKFSVLCLLCSGAAWIHGPQQKLTPHASPFLGGRLNSLSAATVNRFSTGPSREEIVCSYVVHFGPNHYGRLPGTFAGAQSGPGGKPIWIIREDASVNTKGVLIQESRDETPGRLPICMDDEILKCPDVSMEVRFKCVAGTVSQSAGVVVRHTAAGFYTAQVDLLSRKVSLLRVLGDKAELLKESSSDITASTPLTSPVSVVDEPPPSTQPTTQTPAQTLTQPPAQPSIQPPPQPAQPLSLGTWHRLKLTADGTTLSVELDGHKMLEVTDDALPGEGRMGVSTRADAVTAFAVLFGRRLR